MLKERIKNDLIQAMKNGDKEKRDLLRFVSAQIKQKEIDEKKELNDNEVISVIKKELKQTAEVRAIADSDELIRREEYLNKYIPTQLSEAAIYAIVFEYKVKNSDMKLAMKELMAKYGTIADKKVLSETIRKVYSA